MLTQTHDPQYDAFQRALAKTFAERAAQERNLAPAQVIHIGAPRKGPKRCIQCGKPFRTGEAWLKMTSDADPEHGAYSIGVHVQCQTK